MSDSLVKSLAPLVESAGFDHYGFSPLKNPTSIEAYEQWLKKGYHGEMSYLETHLPIKKNPESHFKGLFSAIVIAKPYFPPQEQRPSSKLRVAEYAKSKDYHLTFKEELENLRSQFTQIHPEEEFLCFTDSGPILERDLAYRAGLGWIGKNTCLIDRRKGSLFFIGEILTSLQFEEPSKRVSDFCGTCTKCLDICPTNALKPGKILDAKLCISYLTIEAKDIPPKELRPQISDWFFGCDLCQTVCPWNEKSNGKSLMQALTKESLSEISSEIISELREILTLSNKELMKKYVDSPLIRARGFGLKRNALILISNLQIKDLTSEIHFVSRQWPRLRGLCNWTLETLGSDC